jgi:hypothetical protein
MIACRPALALILLLTMAGCPRPRVDFGPDGVPQSAEEVLKRVAAAELQVVSVKGDARLAVDAPQGKGTVTLFLAVQEPTFIHIEQLDFFNRPQGVLTTDGKRFGLYDAQSGRYLRGPATAPNLGRLLPLVMPPDELAALLLGRVPRLPGATAELRFDDALQLLVVTLKRGEAVQTLHVQPPQYRVVKSAVQGLKAYDVEAADLTPYGTVSLPRTLRLDARQAKTHLELTFKDLAVNEAPDLTMFEMSAPEGVPVIEVDERGAELGAAAP